MLREIVLDTETTGLDPRNGDRLIEVGCIELFNRIPTGREFHRYINPERAVPAEAEAVHGLSTAFLKDKPLFAEVATDLIAFLGEDMLVIHNAAFDVGFLNAELGKLGMGQIAMARVVDTLQLARRKHPAGPNSLDALCKRYGVDNSRRVKHGALMDSMLLASVYVELLGERQATLGLAKASEVEASGYRITTRQIALKRPTPLPPRLSDEDREAHRRFLGLRVPNALWWRFFPSAQG